MLSFTSINSHPDPSALVERGIRMKRTPRAWHALGEGRTLGLIFMNPSLRTRLSTQKAGMSLGMDVMVMNVGGGDGWNLEIEKGVVMDGDRQEHVVEAARVISSYCDIVGIRAFASLKDRGEDDAEPILSAFSRESSSPIVNMESATEHPMQGLADMMTIRERFPGRRPRVVLSWAPHPRALPHAVPNSFASWARALDFDLVVTHPEGYELNEIYTGADAIEYDQEKALDGADVVYAKNWSATEPYGAILSQDRSWMIDQRKMELTRDGIFMHCLPVRRNVIVSDDVLDSPASVVIEQAKNREYAAQVVLAEILESLIAEERHG